MGYLKIVIMVALMALLVQGNPREEADSSIENVSSFLIELIDKYDKSGTDLLTQAREPLPSNNTRNS